MSVGRFGLLALALAGALLASCSRAPKPHNLVLVTIDTLRADRVSARARDGSPLTPEIDRLAARGVRFTHAYSQTNITNPSHLSILSGFYPKNHGVHDNSTRAPHRLVTLPDRLRRAGFATAGFVSAFHLQGLSGLDRCFETFPAPPGKFVRAAETVDRALSWLATRRGEARPFFLWVHVYDPHRPYDPPFDVAARCLPPGSGSIADIEAALERAPERKRREILRREGLEESEVRSFMDGVRKSGRHRSDIESRAAEAGDSEPVRIARAFQARRALLAGSPYSEEERRLMAALYDGEVAYADRELGRLFEKLSDQRLRDDTVLVVTADHGENLGEHEMYFNHRGIYDTTLRVPLVISGPGIPAGRVVNDPVQLVDLVPTALDLIGAPAARDVDGLSIAPIVRGESQSLRDRALFHECAYALATAVREGGMKYVLPVGSPPPAWRNELWNAEALYDLEEDPEELSPRATDPATRQHLKDLVTEFLSREPRFPREAGDADSGPTPEDVARLRALGYVY